MRIRLLIVVQDSVDQPVLHGLFGTHEGLVHGRLHHRGSDRVDAYSRRCQLYGQVAHHRVHAKHGGPNGLISAMSVRWTTGRSTAEDAIDLVEKKLGRSKTRCRTAWTPVFGGDFSDIQHLIDAISEDDLMGKLPEETRERIVHAHGTEWTAIKRLIAENPGDSELVTGSTITTAEIRYAVRNEHVKHLADVVFRRTELGTGSHPRSAALNHCARILGAELNWSEEQYQHELDDVAARYPLSNISRPVTPTYSPKVSHG